MSAIEKSKATVPVDLEAMRKTVRAVLLPDGGSPAELEAEDAATAAIKDLRGHLERLIPVVEDAAGEPDSIARYCTLACVGEARRKLQAEPLPRPGGPLAYARRLARVLTALCDHHESMSGEPR
ncbi:DUF6415 family natural product biosynthesis protein [Streptomyces sp. NPDC058534]|uniref:DUF6415 family natural product biosynthesis protein n=1 Tax=Streptomyces sp. NPDC058534 TaxID=3346541 RepID=UPI003655B309